jgi:hypothetical protein
MSMGCKKKCRNLNFPPVLIITESNFAPSQQLLKVPTAEQFFVSPMKPFYGHRALTRVVVACLLQAQNLLRPDQGDIVGREYIISSKCLGPYGILLADLTIARNLNSYISSYAAHRNRLECFTLVYTKRPAGIHLN